MLWKNAPIYFIFFFFSLKLVNLYFYAWLPPCSYVCNFPFLSFIVFSVPWYIVSGISAISLTLPPEPGRGRCWVGWAQCLSYLPASRTLVPAKSWPCSIRLCPWCDIPKIPCCSFYPPLGWTQHFSFLSVNRNSAEFALSCFSYLYSEIYTLKKVKWFICGELLLMGFLMFINNFSICSNKNNFLNCKAFQTQWFHYRIKQDSISCSVWWFTHWVWKVLQNQ